MRVRWVCREVWGIEEGRVERSFSAATLTGCGTDLISARRHHDRAATYDRPDFPLGRVDIIEQDVHQQLGRISDDTCGFVLLRQFDEGFEDVGAKVLVRKVEGAKEKRHEL